MATINRLDNVTPARISTNVSIERQTPNRDFGNRLKAGLEATGSAVGSAASVVGGLIPGGAIVSAAVSSVGSLARGTGATGGGGAVTSAYAATGVVNLGMGGSTGSTGINTTVGGGTTPGVGSVGGGLPTTGGGFPNSLGTTNTGNTMGDMNQQLIQSQADNAKLMGVQIQMQHENQVFTSVSNVLKTRHDTVKNSIGNIH
jgi:hypothetical protein